MEPRFAGAPLSRRRTAHLDHPEPDTHMQKPSINDLYLHKSLSSLSSAEGGWVFKVGTVDADQDRNRSSLWLYDRAGRCSRLTAAEQSAFGPQWSCDGEEVAFLRHVDGQAQVHTIAIGGGEPRRVTDWDGGVVAVEQWNTRRGKLLVLAHKIHRPDDEPQIVDYLPYKLDGVGHRAGRSTYVYVADEHSGACEPLVESGGDVTEARWAPDGETLAYLQRRGGAQRHALDLWLKRSGCEPRRLTTELVSISGLSWSPDGAHIAMAGCEVEGSSISGLYVIEIESGRAQRIGEIELAIPSAIQWQADGTRLLALEAFRGSQRIVAASLQGEVRVVCELERQQILDMAAEGDRIVFIAAGLCTGPELWQAYADGSDAHAVTSFNDWRLQRPRPKADRHRFQVPDGQGGSETVEGWLLLPEGDGPFPLLMDMHGGPHSYVSFDYETHVHWPVLVDQGWAVLALNAVGSSSYGLDFAKRICGHWGQRDLPQWLEAVRQLREQGIAGRELAVFGHSYGGFLSAWTLSHEVPLICGAVSAGVLNLESHSGTSDTGYYVGPYSVGCELDHDRDLYRRLSPLNHAEKIKAPVLLLQGANDERCPLGQAEELFAQLIRIGKAPARLVVFPGGSHHLSSTGRPSHRVAYYRQLAEWLQSHRLKQPERTESAASGAARAMPAAREREHAVTALEADAPGTRRQQAAQ